MEFAGRLKMRDWEMRDGQKRRGGNGGTGKCGIRMQGWKMQDGICRTNMRGWKMREWNMRHQYAGVENTGQSSMESLFANKTAKANVGMQKWHWFVISRHRHE